MPKNVKILEDGTAKYLANVAKIETQLSNGRKCYWIPEDEVPLGVLNVTEDGVYRASEDESGPYYGYSEVHVEGVGHIVMGDLAEITVEGNGTYEAAKEKTGPFLGYSKVVVNVTQETSSHKTSGTVGVDQDGDDAIATVNPDTGEIEIHKLDDFMPASIKIVTPPTFTGPYGGGAIIGFDGMVVMACDEDGNHMYEIPFEELLTPEMVARYDPESETDEGYTIDDTSILEWPDSYTLPIKTGGELRFVNMNTNETKAYPITSENVISACFRQTGSTGVMGYYYSLSKISYDYYTDGTKTGSRTSTSWITTLISGRTVYWAQIMAGQVRDLNVPINDFGGSISLEDVATILFDGTFLPGGCKQSIPVQWPRPGDGEVLETSFSIEVVDVSPSEN